MSVAGELPWEAQPSLAQLLAVMLAGQDWLDEIACHDKPEEWFFRSEERGGGPHFWDKARAVCAGCPVRDACLAWGMDTDHGMFGGLTPAERQALRAGAAA